MDTVTFNIWYTQKLDANFNFGNMVLHDLFFSKQLCCYYVTHCGKSHIFVTKLKHNYKMPEKNFKRKKEKNYKRKKNRKKTVANKKSILPQCVKIKD